jgi:hypothetical protein
MDEAVRYFGTGQDAVGIVQRARRRHADFEVLLERGGFRCEQLVARVLVGLANGRGDGCALRLRSGRGHRLQ